MPLIPCPTCRNVGAYCSDPGDSWTGRRAVFVRCDCLIGRLVGRKLSDLPAEDREGAARMIMAAMDEGVARRRGAQVAQVAA